MTGCKGFAGFCPNAVDVSTAVGPESICGCDPTIGSQVDAVSAQAVLDVMGEALDVANKAYQALREVLDPHGLSVLHQIPPDGSGLTPCCGRTLFELPRTDRTTEAPWRVTCKGVRNAAS